MNCLDVVEVFHCGQQCKVSVNAGSLCFFYTIFLTWGLNLQMRQFHADVISVDYSQFPANSTRVCVGPHSHEAFREVDIQTKVSVKVENL